VAIPPSIETGLVPPLPPRRGALHWVTASIAGLATAIGCLFWTPQLVCGNQPASIHDPAGTAFGSCVEGALLVGGLAGLLLGALIGFVLLRLLQPR
jgi:hypothetical protein